MSIAGLSLIIVGALILLAVITFVARRTSTLNRQYFKSQWVSIEEMARTKATWVQAIVDADKLLDEALKQCHYNGKTVADRMVSAARAFSDTDSLWRAHKIRNKVVHESGFNLKKAHVNMVMGGIKQALKDLQAL